MQQQDLPEGLSSVGLDCLGTLLGQLWERHEPSKAFNCSGKAGSRCRLPATVHRESEVRCSGMSCQLCLERLERLDSLHCKLWKSRHEADKQSHQAGE